MDLYKKIDEDPQNSTLKTNLIRKWVKDMKDISLKRRISSSVK